jgi:SAM-dependent methyltransferase
LETVTWRDFWRPCRPFFERDTRLIHRLNRLKKAWLHILGHPLNRGSQMTYCWRFFGLLHHLILIAQTQKERLDPLAALRRTLSFESFPLEAIGETGISACTVTSRNPVFVLGQLPANSVVPTPRHVPLLLPCGRNEWFYHYRQILLRGVTSQSLLMYPSAELKSRANSFAPIDRAARLLSERADPYWKPRARLLARRVLSPLLYAWRNTSHKESPTLSILDLGAGTGQMLAKAWRYLERSCSHSLPKAVIQFVDSSPPTFGRSFGLSRDRSGITHVEWTTGDYRKLVDDDEWLTKCGPFDWVFANRLFDNASNFFIEPVDAEFEGQSPEEPDCLPHYCLAHSRQPDGIRHLMVSPVRKQMNTGGVFPQFSLRDYFAAMLAVRTGSIDAIRPNAWYLPVRRFNPASLITPSGRSLISQLMKVSRAFVIEDVDVEPEHLKQHREQFGLADTAAVYCTRDGFSTTAKYYVVTRPAWVGYLQGERLW